MNERVDLPGMLLNHLITASVFFHWFMLVDLTMLELILGRISLLIIPISDFDGFISLQYIYMHVSASTPHQCNFNLSVLEFLLK